MENDITALIDRFLRGEMSIDEETKFKKEIQGSNIWRDFRVEGVKLKTLEGKPLQSFDNINAIILRFKDKYVINNVMWI